ncbi:MAG: S8 family serine peptidase [Clostridia bacterium]|nr:S8 family serine peptidase [Clostridia bacterium]
MKNLGVNLKVIFCGLVLVACALLIAVNLTIPSKQLSATVVNQTVTTSFDDFATALAEMNESHEPTENSLVFFDKATAITTDENGEYLVSEQVYQQATGVLSAKRLSANAFLRTKSNSMRRLTELAAETGYQVTTGNYNLVLTRPYGLKRLIIFSDSTELDIYGAVAHASYNSLHIHQYATEADTQAAYAYYQTCPAVQSVMPDAYCWIENETVDSQNFIDITTENTATYRSWGAAKMGVPEFQKYLVDTIKAANNNVSDLPEIVVAVLDTGIDTDHPLFANRILLDENSNFIGKDFTHVNDATQYAFEDDQGHGTYCAGIICDLTLPNVKILPVKFMYTDPENPQLATGKMSNAIAGVEYVVNMRKKYNIAVMNMSFGVDDPTNKLNDFSYQINQAFNQGIFSVVAAGNNRQNVATYAPANVNRAITVSALKLDANELVFDNSYSNFGNGIDVCAPGTKIICADITGDFTNSENAPSGTSLAAPHVAAYIALLESDQLHTYSQNDIYQILTDSNSPYLQELGLIGKDSEYGNGMPILTTATPNYVTLDIKAGDLGQVAPLGYNLYAKGSSVTLEFTPDEDCYVSAIHIDGNLVTNSKGMTQYKFENLTTSHTIEVDFESNGYTVKYYLEDLYDLNTNTTHHYTVQTEKFTGEIGALTTVVAKPFAGFTAQPFEQQIITANGSAVVEIYYKRNKYQVTAQKADEDKGVLQITGTSEYLFGAKVALKPTFRSGFGLRHWVLDLCNDLTFTNNFNPLTIQQEFTMPASDLIMTLYAQEGIYQISVKVTGNGSVTPEEVWVKAGSAMIFEAKADTGYRIKSVTCGGIELKPTEIGDGVYSVNVYDINDNSELVVAFTKQKSISHHDWLNYVIWGGGSVFAVILFTGSGVLLFLAHKVKKRHF